MSRKPDLTTPEAVAAKGPRRPGRVRSDLSQVRSLAEEVGSKAKRLAKEYEEAYDAYLHSLRGGMRVIPKKGGAHADPTGNTALSGDYRAMQGVLKFVSNKAQDARGKLAAASLALDAALGDAGVGPHGGNGLHGRWLDTDPDYKRDRRDAKIAAREEAKKPQAS